MKYYKIVIINLFLVLNLYSIDTWNLIDKNDDMKLYEKNHINSDYNEYKITTLINSSQSSLLSLFYDIKNYPKWFLDCEEVTLIKRIDFKKNYIYQINNLPFPMNNRDAIYLTELSNDSRSSKIVLKCVKCSRIV